MDVGVLAPHDKGLATVDTVAGVEVHRFRYGLQSMERLSYRGGLLGSSRRFSGVMLPAYLASFSKAAEKAARDFRPDVIHAHWWLPAGLCALPVARRLDVPLIITVHGSDVHLLRYRALRKLASHVMHRASLVATVSEDLQRQILEFDPRLHTTVLRLPVPAGPPAVAMPDDPPIRLLAAGRLSHEKGFDVLIEAMRIAVGSGLDVRLDIVGSGPRASPPGSTRRPARRSNPAHPRTAARRADAPARRCARSGRSLASRGPRHGRA